MTWSHFAHGADIGLRGEGQSKEEAFEEIARALTGVVTELESVEAEEPDHAAEVVALFGLRKRRCRDDVVDAFAGDLREP